MTEHLNFDALQEKLLEIARQPTEALKAQTEARRDVAKTLVSLASAALLFTITFASTLIRPNTTLFLRYSIAFCWLAFICSLVMSLLSLWFSISLGNFPALLMTKSEKIKEIAAESNESLSAFVADTWQEIVRDDKLSRRSLGASFISYGIALLIFIIVGVRQLIL